jgi:hypothetical protein
MKAYIKYARGIPKMVKTDIQDNLQGPLPKTYVELGIADFGGLADFYSKDVAPTLRLGERSRSAKTAERCGCRRGAGDVER